MTPDEAMALVEATGHHVGHWSPFGREEERDMTAHCGEPQCEFAVMWTHRSDPDSVPLWYSSNDWLLHHPLTTPPPCPLLTKNHKDNHNAEFFRTVVYGTHKERWRAEWAARQAQSAAS